VPKQCGDGPDVAASRERLGGTVKSEVARPGPSRTAVRNSNAAGATKIVLILERFPMALRVSKTYWLRLKTVP
jgi:hypothetical protein